MKNTELNTAIRMVLMNRHKKDAKQAHKIVKAAGYTIIKWSGSYEVKNEATGRWIRIDFGRYRATLEWTGKSTTPTTLNNDIMDKFDFVGELNKPINMEWREMRRYTCGWQPYRPTITKYDNLKFAKNRVEWRNRDIEMIQEQIANLQKNLIREVESRERAKAELKETRKRLGLRG